MNMPLNVKQRWQEAAILALIAALLLELGINVFSERTIWHRLDKLEHSVQQLEQERESK